MNNPYVARVDAQGRWVVTVGTRCSTTHAHMIVVYGPSGTVLRDYSLESLLTADEIRTYQQAGQPEGAAIFFVNGGDVVFGEDSVWLSAPLVTKRSIVLWSRQSEKR